MVLSARGPEALQVGSKERVPFEVVVVRRRFLQAETRYLDGRIFSTLFLSKKKNPQVSTDLRFFKKMTNKSQGSWEGPTAMAL